MSVEMLGVEEGSGSGNVSACQQLGEVGRMAGVRIRTIVFCREEYIQVSAKRDTTLKRLKCELQGQRFNMFELLL